MTTRIMDVAPHEALLAELIERSENSAIHSVAISELEIQELLKLYPESAEVLRTLLHKFAAPDIHTAGGENTKVDEPRE